MPALTETLAKYAAYHRDHRNIVTHMFGIPMIVVAVAILTSRPMFGAPVPLTPGLVLSLILVVYYLRLDLALGLAMALFLAASLWLGHALALRSTGLWLTAGGGLFIVGWAIQFLGHKFEGRKPAFLDDLMGLAVGPLFIAAELAFLLGLRRDLQSRVDAQAVQRRDALKT